MGKFLSGLAEVLTSTSTIQVALGAEYDAKPAFACLNEQPTGSNVVQSCEWDGSGNLTIRLVSNTSAPRTVAYFVDGR